MSPEEIQELLRKAGVSEDQWKYYTASSEELPGLFGFSGSQGSENFLAVLGDLTPQKFLKHTELLTNMVSNKQLI